MPTTPRGERGALQVAHLDLQPDRLDRANLAALCLDCYAAWEESHVMAASALTRWVRWCGDLGNAADDAIEHVRRYGLGRLTSAMVDVVTADILLDGPWTSWMLTDILQDVFGRVDHGAARRVMEASLRRLRMRGLHVPRQVQLRGVSVNGAAAFMGRPTVGSWITTPHALRGLTTNGSESFKRL